MQVFLIIILLAAIWTLPGCTQAASDAPDQIGEAAVSQDARQGTSSSAEQPAGQEGEGSSPEQGPAQAGSALDQGWSKISDRALSQALYGWELSVGEHYTPYTPKSPGQTPKTDVEAVLQQAKIQDTGGASGHYPIAWSETGAEPDQYNVVAYYVRNDVEDQGQQTAYLFTILNGQPLVFESREIAAGQPLNFSPCQDPQVAAIFEDVFNS